jgi:hypothetical protein
MLKIQFLLKIKENKKKKELTTCLEIRIMLNKVQYLTSCLQRYIIYIYYIK